MSEPKSSERTIIESLMFLGLTSYEARTYTSLVQMGQATASEISRHSRVPKSKIYDVLESLREKGFVYELVTGDTKEYRPFSPNDTVRAKKNEFENVITHTLDALQKIEEKTLVQTAENLNFAVSGFTAIQHALRNWFPQDASTELRLLHSKKNNKLIQVITNEFPTVKQISLEQSHFFRPVRSLAILFNGILTVLIISDTDLSDAFAVFFNSKTVAQFITGLEHFLISLSAAEEPVIPEVTGPTVIETHEPVIVEKRSIKEHLLRSGPIATLREGGLLKDHRLNLRGELTNLNFRLVGQDKNGITEVFILPVSDIQQVELILSDRHAWLELRYLKDNDPFVFGFSPDSDLNLWLADFRAILGDTRAYCKRCGYENHPEANFCRKCGAQL